MSFNRLICSDVTKFSIYGHQVQLHAAMLLGKICLTSEAKYTLQVQQ